jgi:signal transduction protein with GAF and PtsI domain
MLAKLQEIVQRVNAAAGLHEALEIIVHRVKVAMDTNACYIFVRDPAAPQYVLMATEGLNPWVHHIVRTHASGASESHLPYAGADGWLNSIHVPRSRSQG